MAVIPRGTDDVGAPGLRIRRRRRHHVEAVADLLPRRRVRHSLNREARQLFVTFPPDDRDAIEGAVYALALRIRAEKARAYHPLPLPAIGDAFTLDDRHRSVRVSYDYDLELGRVVGTMAVLVS